MMIHLKICFGQVGGNIDKFSDNFTGGDLWWSLDESHDSSRRQSTAGLSGMVPGDFRGLQSYGCLDSQLRWRFAQLWRKSVCFSVFLMATIRVSGFITCCLLQEIPCDFMEEHPSAFSSHSWSILFSRVGFPKLGSPHVCHRVPHHQICRIPCQVAAASAPKP